MLREYIYEWGGGRERGSILKTVATPPYPVNPSPECLLHAFSTVNNILAMNQQKNLNLFIFYFVFV